MAVDSRIYWIWLAQLLGPGNKLASKLLNLYGDAHVIYDTPMSDLFKTDNNFLDKDKEALKNTLSDKNLEAAQNIFDECSRLKINIAVPYSPEYPKSLYSLTDMPIVLYYRGTIPIAERLFVAVVGTRKMSDYGRKTAYSLGYGMALGGAVLVSGMALGADSMAMIGAMDAGAPAVAVLGSGVDVIYPKEHRELYYKTISNGAVISEYPPGSPPSAHHFPVRNRIISGISDGTVVVEGDSKSGSLITAKCAVAQGKKIFAVPGKVGEPGSEGPNDLLRDGAIPVLTPEDVLAEFAFLYPHTVNVNYVHAKLRGMDFDEPSRNSMEKNRIGVRGGDSQYGKGIYGGRLSEYKRDNSADSVKSDTSKNETATKRKIGLELSQFENASAPSAKNGSNTYASEEFNKAASAPKMREPQAKLSFAEKVKKPIIESIFGKNSNKSDERREKAHSKSEENVNLTTGFALNMLDENDIKVYNIMQPNVPVVPDELVDKLASDGLAISDIMSALSTLELAGAVESSVGGYFVRVGDNMPVTLDSETESKDENN